MSDNTEKKFKPLISYFCFAVEFLPPPSEHMLDGFTFSLIFARKRSWLYLPSFKIMVLNMVVQFGWFFTERSFKEAGLSYT